MRIVVELGYKSFGVFADFKGSPADKTGEGKPKIWDSHKRCIFCHVETRPQVCYLCHYGCFDVGHVKGICYWAIKLIWFSYCGNKCA